MTTSDTTSSRERQLQFAAGAVSLGCALAAVLTVLISLGQWWVEPASRASLAGTTSAAVEPPEPLRDRETYVQTRILPSGDLVVTQWIESTPLLFGVTLALPRVAGAEVMTAEQVRVVADGTNAVGPKRISLGRQSTYAFLGTSSVRIRYRLTGAIELSPSVPGRALARLTALDVTYEPASAQVTRAVIAPEVLSLACSSPEQADEIRPCGDRASKGRWTVDLSGPQVDDRVMAALSLG